MASASPSGDDRALARSTWVLLAAAGVGLCLHVASGPQLYDAGELAAAAIDLGGSHPPGQPLPSLLGHVVAWLPLGPIPLRLGLLSLACALGAALFAARIGRELCAELGIDRAGPRAGCEAACVGGVLLASPVLRQALRIEVYTLALLLYLAATLELLAWARSARPSRLWTGAVYAGLCACVHPPHALACALTALALALFQPRRLLAAPRTTAYACLFGVLPLCMLVYLPVRAHAGASMWGDPTTLSGFWFYVSGKAFLERAGTGGRLDAGYAVYLARINGTIPWLGMTLLIWPALGRRSPVAFGMIAASAVAIVVACIQPLEVRNPDNVAYLGPALALAVVIGAAGFSALLVRGPRAFAVLGLGLVAIPPSAPFELPQFARTDTPALETLSAMLAEAAPPRALVITRTDFIAGAWLMSESLERVRPDAAMFVEGLSTSSWQWQRLAHHPGLSGKPVRGPGKDSHEAYTRGAVLSALPSVPVMSESDLRGAPVARITGPLLELGRLAAGEHPATDAHSLAERWLSALVRDAAHGDPGDSDAAAAVVRQVLGQRSLRLLRAGHNAAALRSAALALWALPQPERGALTASQAEPVRLPVIVDDPSSYLTSTEDAVRLVAAELWALGERTRASELLQAQHTRGDPHALLQLAYLQAYDNDVSAASHTLALLDQHAPQLHAAAGALRRALQR